MFVDSFSAPTQLHLTQLHRALWLGKELPRREGDHYPLWWYNPQYRDWLTRHYGDARYHHEGVVIGGECHMDALEALAERNPRALDVGNIALQFRERHEFHRSSVFADGVISVALFDPDGVYRYWLSRQWSCDVPLIVIMLNPSTADAYANDPTVARIEKLARRSGYGGYIVLNLAAYRATKPAELKHVEDPVGPYNVSVLRQTLSGVIRRWRMPPDTLIAWGADANKFPLLKQRVRPTIRACAARGAVLQLATCKDGTTPRHPLYLKGPHTLNPLTRIP